MKNYLSTKKVNSRRALLPRSLIVVTCIVLLGTVSLWLVPKVVTTVVAVALAPFEAVRTWVIESNDSLPTYLRQRQALDAELEALRQQVAISAGTDSTLAKLTTENNQFRALCAAIPEERIIARVVGRPPQLPYDVLLLDRGAKHAVQEKAPVFLGADQVIGYVSRVYTNTALVTLVTTAGFRSMAYVLGPNIYTFAEGTGNGLLRVVVPQGIPFSIGDTVILPAIDSGSYGQIAHIETTPTNPEQLGYVPMSVNLQQMQYVSVGREPIIPHTFEEAEILISTLATDLFTVALPPGVLVNPLEVATSSATSSSAMSSQVSQSAL